jgi:integrase/recombinase XerD
MDKDSALQEFKKDLLVRNFSIKTIEGYYYQLGLFFDYFASVPDEIDPFAFREYFIHIKELKKYSTSTMNCAYSAIRSFYERILLLRWPAVALGRAKVENKLPVILSQEEMKKLFLQIKNLKHQAIVALLYSAGLRTNELLTLKVTDIDSHQMYITVRGGKGYKDRTTLLSAQCLELLREYYRKYRPVDYLFNSPRPGQQYSTTSMRNILAKAARKARITKHLTPHTLRHCFATHLLENGANLFYIKELMGHKSIRTTMVYLHLCSKDVKNIINPFDKLMERTEQ